MEQNKIEIAFNRSKYPVKIFDAMKTRVLH